MELAQSVIVYCLSMTLIYSFPDTRNNLLDYTIHYQIKPILYAIGYLSFHHLIIAHRPQVYLMEENLY